MPRPEQTPVARYQGLPYGANAVANAGIDAAEDMDQEVDEGFDEQDEFQPADEDEAFLFSPTDRPDEPVTSGMSFGAGSDFSRFAHESNADMLNRVADSITTDPAASKEVRAFAARVKRGY